MHVHERVSGFFGWIAIGGGVAGGLGQFFAAVEPFATGSSVIMTMTGALSATIGVLIVSYGQFRKVHRDAAVEDAKAMSDTWEGRYRSLDSKFAAVIGEKDALKQQIESIKTTNRTLVNELRKMRKEIRTLSCRRLEVHDMEHGLDEDSEITPPPK